LLSAPTQEQFVMAESPPLVAQPRDQIGTRRARRLRQQGLIPAVVYGHKEQTLSLSVPAEDVHRAIRHGVRVVDLQAGGKTEKALIRDVQWDHLGLDVLHVDFARVSADERIAIEVRLEIRGTAPGVAQGGVLDQPLHTIRVECPALSPPDAIRVNVGELQLGQALYVKDLKLPDGVTALSDPDAVVVHVTQKAVEEVPVAAAVPTTAEPEVIGRKAGEEGEGAE
jgi:large subunit ribosomal protein L25